MTGSSGMTKTRICIYGGTRLEARLESFAGEVTRRLLDDPSVVLVSGGFERYRNRPRSETRLSVDSAVLRAAEEVLGGGAFDARFEAWLPKTGKRRSVIRFERGRVRWIEGSTQARRFTLVQDVDALITIGGEGNTRAVLELALAIDRRAFPVGFSGGDSKRSWRGDNPTHFARWFGLDAAELERFGPDASPDDEELPALAGEVAQLVLAAAERRCLVLMPFAREADAFYDVLRNAVEAAGCRAERIDHDDFAGDVYRLFRRRLGRAHAVIVDITGWNRNVMYELGHVHSLDIAPLIIRRRRPGDPDDVEIPFYLQRHMRVEAPGTTEGWEQIGRRLTAFLGVRRPGGGAELPVDHEG